MAELSARAEAVTRRTYNRPLDVEGTVFETWDETIERAQVDHQRNLWQNADGIVNEDELSELRQLGLERKACVSGRTLWLGGTKYAYERAASQFNCSATVVRSVYDVVDFFWLLLNGCGVGGKPSVGVLHGYTSKIPGLHIIPSTRDKDFRGIPQNIETFADGDWIIRIGDSAEAWAKAALSSDPDQKTRDRIVWLPGMIRFYQADFVGACEFLPDLGDKPKPDDGWWTKNMLTLIRARIRSGSIDIAGDLIRRVEESGSKWSHLGIALPAVRGWIALKLGDAGESDKLADRAGQELASLRAAIADRNRRGLDNPVWYDEGATQAAVVDLAALLSLRGRAEEALALLEPLERLFSPLLTLIAMDPAFAPLRNAKELGRRLGAWLDQRAAE